MSGLSDESSYDPSIPPEKQIVTYITKEGEIRKVTKLELQDQLEASEKLMESLNLTWEEKLQKTQAIHIEREKALEELGISIDTNVSNFINAIVIRPDSLQMVGVHAPQNHPSLVNLNEGRSSSSKVLARTDLFLRSPHVGSTSHKNKPS